MTPNAHGSRRKSEHFSELNGICFNGFDVENNCPLPGWLHYFLRNGWRTPWTSATSFWKVSSGEPQNQPNEVRILPDTGTFFGHIISKDVLEADPEKVAAVKTFPIPTRPTEVKCFLGLCSYYRRYVKNFADIARPLHKASENNSPFLWTTEAQDAFETLKQKLTSNPILALPSMKETFILYTDASLTVYGSCPIAGTRWSRESFLLCF